MIKSTPIGLSLAILTWALCQSVAFADLIYLQSGAAVRGQILGFDGQRYRVMLEGEQVTYEANEIRSFAIDRTQTDQGTMQLELIMRRLDVIDSKLDGFKQTYHTTAAEMQQRIFDLNPISQVRVQSQDGTMRRDGRYQVRGRLVNESNQWVRNFRLRGNLYDDRGNLVSTVDTQTLAGDIGPGASRPYEVLFENPPRNVGRVEIIPYLPTRTSDEDIGGYQMQSPAVRYR